MPASNLIDTSTKSTYSFLSLPPEIIFLIAEQLTYSWSSSSRCTLTFCHMCNLPLIHEMGKMSLLALGLSHPVLYRILSSKWVFGWLYRCWKWLSERPIASDLFSCDFWSCWYRWDRNWPTLFTRIEVVRYYELFLGDKKVSIITTDPFYIWCYNGRNFKTENWLGRSIITTRTFYHAPTKEKHFADPSCMLWKGRPFFLVHDLPVPLPADDDPDEPEDRLAEEVETSSSEGSEADLDNPSNEDGEGQEVEAEDVSDNDGDRAIEEESSVDGSTQDHEESDKEEALAETSSEDLGAEVDAASSEDDEGAIEDEKRIDGPTKSQGGIRYDEEAGVEAESSG